MAASSLPANLFDRYDSGNNVRESVSRMITMISPTDTAFLSMIPSSETVGNHKHEWLVDELKAASTANAVRDGADFGAEAVTKADRRGNYLQISRKDIQISGRSQNADAFGRLGTMKYHIMKAAKELKRDVDAILTSPQIPVAGNNTASSGAGLPGKTGGFPVYLKTNVDYGGSYSAPTIPDDGIPSGSITAGTARALSMDTVLKTMRVTWENGGQPNCLVVPAVLKEGISKYLYTDGNPRVAEVYADQGRNPPTKGATVQGSVSVFITDFGALDIVIDRWMPANAKTTTVFLVDKDKLKMAYFKGRKYIMEKIAKTGDSMKRSLLVDYALMVMDEKAHGIVGDINSTSPVAD